MNKDMSNFLDKIVGLGCSICGNSYVDLLINKDEGGVIEYKTGCPNCGHEIQHKLLHGFKKNEEVFILLKEIMKGEKHEKTLL